jgi:hypothetical protein
VRGDIYHALSVPLLSAVFMYQAAPTAGAKLINPLPEVASSMNFEVNIEGRFLM